MNLAIDLYCGLGGWAGGFLTEGYEVVGFDIERHDYGSGGYPGQLVLQDALTLHGSQFRGAACIVASPPCQEFSYMAMPWKRAKQIAKALRGHGEFPEGYTGSRTVEQLTALFDACFRIQREACEAAGHHIPMVVENVKGAQPWVGMAKARYGSFFLWGDVESVGGRIVASRAVRFGADSTRAFKAVKSGRPNREGVMAWTTGRIQGYWSDVNSQKNDHIGGGSWFAIGSPGQTNVGQTNVGQNPDGRKVPMNFHEHEKTGKPGRSFQSAAVESQKQPVGSKSSARKAASAQIAKIPGELAAYIARSFRPADAERVA